MLERGGGRRYRYSCSMLWASQLHPKWPLYCIMWLASAIVLFTSHLARSSHMIWSCDLVVIHSRSAGPDLHPPCANSTCSMASSLSLWIAPHHHQRLLRISQLPFSLRCWYWLCVADTAPWLLPHHSGAQECVDRAEVSINPWFSGWEGQTKAM